MGPSFPKRPITAKGRIDRVSSLLIYIYIISLSSDNVRRARHAYSDALEALKLGNLEDAAAAADEMCYLLALTKIIDPLVEVDNAGKLVSVQIKVILSIFRKLHL